MAFTTTSRKAAAEQFLKLACTDVDRAYAQLVAPGFRHHNVHFKGSAFALKQGMAENLRQFPQKKLEVKRSVEEGDYVVVMSHVRLEASTPGYALMHMFRFEGDRIAELWDVAQEIPATSPNENGPF
ncbi:MAG TPA: nuclear transport factor 2 family protein [Vicinamibacterales bacterium]|nr:nuclear transport factor 2 family protein [Vicinamibacterales bacterium]